MIIFAALLAVLAAIVLMTIRTLAGPTTFDRLLAANSIGNGAILIVALYGFATERPDFLDLALTYALLNYVGVFAVLKFFRGGSLGDGTPEAASQEERVS